MKTCQKYSFIIVIIIYHAILEITKKPNHIFVSKKLKHILQL